MSLSKSVSDCLDMATAALQDLPGVDVAVMDENVLWLTRQLANVVAELQAYLVDIEAGCSTSDFGFFNDDEFLEMLEDLSIEIGKLKSMIRVAKSLGK